MIDVEGNPVPDSHALPVTYVQCQKCWKMVDEFRDGLVTIILPFASFDGDNEHLTEEDYDEIFCKGRRKVCHPCYEAVVDYHHTEHMNQLDEGVYDPWYYLLDG